MTAKKKILVPLATLAAAGAIAVGSGASFSSTSSNTISSVTAGSLEHTNSKNDKAIFSLTNIKPGDVVNGSLTITNTGSLAAAFSLTETASSNGFSAGNLTLDITDKTSGAKVYSGEFGGMDDGAKTDLGTVDAGKATVYEFSVKLKDGAGNGDQKKSASATYTWDSVQLAGVTTNQ